MVVSIMDNTPVTVEMDKPSAKAIKKVAEKKVMFRSIGEISKAMAKKRDAVLKHYKPPAFNLYEHLEMPGYLQGKHNAE